MNPIQQVRNYIDRRMISRYIEAGKRFTIACADLVPFGITEDFARAFNRWQDLETTYISKGFKPIPLETFVYFEFFSVFDIDTSQKFITKIKPGEIPPMHSELYRRHILPDIIKNLDELSKSENTKISIDDWDVPYTSHLLHKEKAASAR